jgi:alkylation response protein AidB-like acyl-CoA dehydrogenase
MTVRSNGRDVAVRDAQTVRAEVRAWLSAHWSSDTPRRTWLELVVDAGWAVPTWPSKWFGRDWPASLAQVVRNEFDVVGAAGAGQDESNLWANTAFAFGGDGLKRRFLRPLLTDALPFCLLYSEPGAGSDLASLQTRADRDGDEWRVTGQKVWTSQAREAEFGMLVARTNWDVPKHQGLTFFFLPMRQPGIEVRPIRQITGEAHFNEVFITDARVSDANRVGEVDAGWRVLQTALAYERAFMGEADRGPKPTRAPSTSNDTSTIWGSSTDLIALARAVGRADDPLVRQRVALVYSLRAVNRWNAQRAAAGLEPGSSSSIQSLGKLAMSRILHVGAKVQTEILGSAALVAGEHDPRGATALHEALNAYFTSIGGGTDQIQRNVIGERLLGLPKEPDPLRDAPFQDVPKSGSRR